MRDHKFSKGDNIVVRGPDRSSKKTFPHTDGVYWNPKMDDIIGLDGYIDYANYYMGAPVYLVDFGAGYNGRAWTFHEDWLEYYDKDDVDTLADIDELW